LSISTPFPFKIVFDAKFFTGKSPSVADEALVTGVHEVVFYRGLPSASSEYAARSGWSYDFGCLLAYDASAGAFLQKAWDSVLSKRLFWDDAHVFVMILRGAK
jgi:predicted glycosyltransferase